tara:strand:+ start:3763 stop:3912 length:150 start_codon:yes stop_codon:yes gene_type:complete
MKVIKTFPISYIVANLEIPIFLKITIYQNFKGKFKKLLIEEINENDLHL